MRNRSKAVRLLTRTLSVPVALSRYSQTKYGNLRFAARFRSNRPGYRVSKSIFLYGETKMFLSRAVAAIG